MATLPKQFCEEFSKNIIFEFHCFDGKMIQLQYKIHKAHFTVCKLANRAFLHTRVISSCHRSTDFFPNMTTKLFKNLESF